ncbi:aspartate carbamoyltransferase regulatory subunit [Patescibacteria group bacterium]
MLSSSLFSASDFTSSKEVMQILRGAKKMIPHAKRMRYNQAIKFVGKLLLQFKESSSRTAGSFETAAGYLGLPYKVIQGTKETSLKKKEAPLDDLITRYGQGYRMYITRTTVEGEARYLAEMMQRIGKGISVLNGGDGENEHITQALLDLLTIWLRLGRLKNFTIGIVGDLKLGRTVHSLIQLLKLFTGINVVLVPFGGLNLPERYRHGLNIVAEGDEDFSLLEQCDVIYLTRIQEERFVEAIDYERVKRIYVFGKEELDACKPKVIVMHPQPINDEISVDIRFDPRVIMDEQAENGVAMRMFLIYRAATQYRPLVIDRPDEDLIISRDEQPAKKARHRDKLIRAIDRGTVLDHLPPEFIDHIIALFHKLGVDTQPTIIPARRVTDSKTVPGGIKDIAFMIDNFISDGAAAILTLFAPLLTVNVLPGDGTIHKIKYRPPSNIQGVFNCPNPVCITNVDRYARSWFVVDNGFAVCRYCERDFDMPSLLHN